MFQESQPKADSFLFFGNMGFLFGEPESNNGNNEEDALQLFQNNLLGFQNLNNISSDTLNNGFTVTQKEYQKDVLYADFEKLQQEKETCQGQTDPFLKQEDAKCLESAMKFKGEEKTKIQKDEKKYEGNKLENQIKTKPINQRENANKTAFNAKPAVLPESVVSQSQNPQDKNIFQLQKHEKHKTSEAKQIQAEISLKKPANILYPQRQIFQPQMTKPLFVLKPMKLERIEEEPRDDLLKERSPEKKINKMQLRSSMNFAKNLALNLEQNLLTNLKEENIPKQHKSIILTKSKQITDENNFNNGSSKIEITQKESAPKDSGVLKNNKINEISMKKQEPTYRIFKTSGYGKNEPEAKKSVFPKFSAFEKQIFDARPKKTDLGRKNDEIMGDIAFDKVTNNNFELEQNEKATVFYDTALIGSKPEENPFFSGKPNDLAPEVTNFKEILSDKNSRIEETSKKEENVNFIPMMNSFFFERQIRANTLCFEVALLNQKILNLKGEMELMESDLREII